MFPSEIEITIRRRVRAPHRSKFFETTTIKGPEWRVRYFYIGNNIFKIARKHNLK